MVSAIYLNGVKSEDYFQGKKDYFRMFNCEFI